MRTKKNPLTIAAVIGAAILSIFIVVDRYYRTTASTRSADETNKKVEQLYRELDAATKARERKEAAGR